LILLTFQLNEFVKEGHVAPCMLSLGAITLVCY